MRYTGPKNRLARREGMDLGLKTPGSKSYSNLLKRLGVPPGQRDGMRRRSKTTDYGFQLREKQKLKRIYGITEKEMKNYFVRAVKTKGNTADYLIRYLEMRLDNIVYQLGFAPTRSSARQLISHGHIKVNEKKVTIPSYALSINSVIGFNNEKSLNIPYIAQNLQKKDLIIPSHLKREGPVGKLIAYPNKSNINEEINLQLAVEFYSR